MSSTPQPNPPPVEVPGAFGAGLLSLTLIEGEGHGPDHLERRKLVEISIVGGDPFLKFDRDALGHLITELGRIKAQL